MKTDLVILGSWAGRAYRGLLRIESPVPVVVIEKGLPGGQLTATETVDNYPGSQRADFGSRTRPEDGGPGEEIRGGDSPGRCDTGHIDK